MWQAISSMDNCLIPLNYRKNRHAIHKRNLIQIAKTVYSSTVLDVTFLKRMNSNQQSK
ncbi:Uncharacterised protein [Sphingobacterium thalpophilum]|uniref:Uncharacterized protein n=1 Tax=Sphingobacterium thalpophilum TaxID=259 RepID=A0A4U9UP66_9SPHI|nr:Uncharacterised protein [Sphingobacterium thalpophilum]